MRNEANKGGEPAPRVDEDVFIEYSGETVYINDEDIINDKKGKEKHRRDARKNKRKGGYYDTDRNS